MDERSRQSLEDMRDHANEALLYAKGQPHGWLEENRKDFLLVQRLLEIVGKAAVHVPDYVRTRIPIPWKSIVGLRDRISNGYVGIDPAALEKVVIEDLPLLVTALDEALKGPHDS